MVSLKTRFLDTVLNSPEKVKQFLIEDGIDGKAVSPIEFFDKSDRDRYLATNNNSKL